MIARLVYYMMGWDGKASALSAEGCGWKGLEGVERAMSVLDGVRMRMLEARMRMDRAGSCHVAVFWHVSTYVAVDLLAMHTFFFPHEIASPSCRTTEYEVECVVVLIQVS